MADERGANDHLPLSVPVYQILLSVSDRALHGYAIIKDVRDRTDGDVDLTASTLYAAIRRLLEADLLVEVDEPDEIDSGDARRRYYRITGFGVEVLQAEAARLERAAEMARDKRVLPAAPSRGR